MSARLNKLIIPVWQRVLIHLYQKSGKYLYAHQIGKDLDVTWATVSVNMKFLHNEGYVYFEKEGRIKLAFLTEEGKHLAEGLARINQKWLI